MKEVGAEEESKDTGTLGEGGHSRYRELHGKRSWRWKLRVAFSEALSIACSLFLLKSMDVLLLISVGALRPGLRAFDNPTIRGKFTPMQRPAQGLKPGDLKWCMGLILCLSSAVN